MKEITFDDLKQLVCEAKNTSKLIEKIGYAILNKVDEDNFPREMRFKAFEMRNIDDISNAATLYCITQEGFDRSDFNKFAREFKSAANELENSGKFKNLDKPIKFTLLAIARDGAWAGCNTTKFMFGENLANESLVEVNDKSSVKNFYIVVERDNPQLGTYLNNVYVGKRRDRDSYILCSYDYYGQRKSLKFSLGKNNDGAHWCINPGSSVYGSMEYYGFDSADEAKTYLKSNWANSKNLQGCLDKLNDM